MRRVLSSLLTFALVAGLLTITPGLDTALVLRSALRQGSRHGYATSFGICAGLLVWGLAAAGGVSVLLTTSRLAYDVVRVAGALFMIWLGAGMLRGAVVKRPAKGFAAEGAVRSPWQGFRWGLLTNLLNPKIGVFYVAVLPGFLPDAAAPAVLTGTALALVHVLLSLVWFSFLILAAGRMRRVLERQRAQRSLDAVTGSVLVGFGVRLALVG